MYTLENSPKVFLFNDDKNDLVMLNVGIKFWLFPIITDSTLPAPTVPMFSKLQSKYVTMHWCRLVHVYTWLHSIVSIRSSWCNSL